MEGEMSDMIKPLAWLIGSWVSVSAKGQLPDKDFEYKETIEFKTCGMQPVLEYSGHSTHPEKGNLMHLEKGFIRGTGDGNFSFMVAHNFGVASIEEGTLSGDKLILKSTGLVRMSSAKNTQVLQTERIFQRLEDGKGIVQDFSMATSKVPELTHHLKVEYVHKL